MNKPPESALRQLAGMLNKPLYVALRQPRDTTRLNELLEAHLRWAVAAEHRGELFASGPFVAEGAATGAMGGMTIVRAETEDVARAILAQDPFVQAGVVAIELRKWVLMEGSFTVNVRFSDQHARIL